MRHFRLALALVAAAIAQAASAETSPTPAEFARYAEGLLAGTYRTDTPGVAVLVMRGDEVLYRGARGAANVESGVPLAAGDQFRIGSVTKQFAAAGLLTLVDAGKLALEDPLSRYLPDYPGGAGITIEQLLNHTSGIQSFVHIPTRRRALTTAQLVNTFKNETPEFAPGDGWAYNNSAYVLVGAVIEVTSGRPWHEYLDHKLFKPLGMSDTIYGADPTVSALHVKGYTTTGIAPARAEQISMTHPHAAGALVSTVDDLARWNRALHERRVLAPATYARMITPVGKAKDVGSGFGIEISAVRGTPSLQHSGGIPGFTSHLIYVPGPDITVAVLQNNETRSPTQHAPYLARRLAAAALGNQYPVVTPVIVDAALLKEYEGVYRVSKDATRTLRVIDGRLTVQRTDRPREQLTAIADDTFVYADGFNRIQMERDAKGHVTGMRFFAEGEGEGTLAERTGRTLWVAIALAAALGFFVVLLLARRSTRLARASDRR